MDERDAIARMRQGDINGLAVVVRAYQVRAVRTAYLITRDTSLAEDVVQAAFLKAYERIAQFDPARPFGPWFLRSVAHDAIKAAERRDRQVSFNPGDELDGRISATVDRDEGPEQIWERVETAEAVWAALGQLTPKQRAAVVQRYYLGLSEAEMAANLESPTSAVKWRLHAARERLRLLLAPLTTD